MNDETLQITADALQQLPPSEYCLLDVREPREKELADMGGDLVPFRLLASCFSEKLDPKQLTIVYCHHGIRSLQAVKFLRQQGYDNVRSLQGGIDHWAKCIDLSLARY